MELAYYILYCLGVTCAGLPIAWTDFRWPGNLVYHFIITYSNINIPILGRNKIAARRCRAKRLRGGVIDPNDPDLDPEDSMDEDFEDEEAMEEDLEAQIVAKHDESSSGRKRKPTVKLSY